MNNPAGVQTIKALSYLDGKPVSIDISDGMISSVEQLPTDFELPEIFVAPGFIDIQVNGYMGVDFAVPDLTVEMVRSVTMALWKEGVTSFLPTLISDSRKNLLKSFSILAQALKDNTLRGSIPGFHLEGPYISPVCGFRGAHPEEKIRKPNWDEFSELLKVSGNAIKIITLAPETDGALHFIQNCVSKGITVALGHHNGTAAVIKAAVDAGASLSTHLGNGCANTIDRHHNPIWPQLADDRLSISIIADGFHITDEEVKAFYKIKGSDKTILVSDTIDLAGLAPGEYIRNGRSLLLTKDVVRYPTENVLAGASSTLKADISRMMNITGCSTGEAIQMASTNPARITSLTDRGIIAPGYRADLVLFTLRNNDMVIRKTFVEGKEVYSKD